jgi:hypothetical protein
MKFIVFLVLILVSVISMADVTPVKRDWKPIIGVSPKAPYVSYYDRNSLEVHTEENGSYTTGTILMVTKEPTTLQVGQSTINVRSLVKNYVIDCKSGLSLAYSDFYFNVMVPIDSSEPVAQIERNLDNAIVLDKKSLLYTVLCPEYI